MRRAARKSIAGARVKRSISLPAHLMERLREMARRDFRGNVSLALSHLILNRRRQSLTHTA